MKALNEIESKMDINKFIYNGENIWPVFRNAIGWELAIKQDVQSNASQSGSLKNKVRVLNTFIVNFLSIFKLFKNYDYVFFTTSDDYRMIDGKIANRLTHEICNGLKDKKILEIQTGDEIKKSSYFTNITYMSNSVFLVLITILSKLLTIKDINKIEKEIAKQNLQIDSKILLKKYLMRMIFFKWIYKRTKAEKVFSTCYSFMPNIKSANDLNLETVEFQHGTIIEHFAYSINKDVNNSFYPNYLCVFGNQDKQYLSSYQYLKDNNNIIPVGNMLVDFYATKKNHNIGVLKNNFKILIGVTLQWTVINEVVNYVKREAKNNQEICFILITRREDELNSFIFEEKNIKIFHHINCYEIVANCDFHLTCYSTCAYEAPSLGTKNIFLNINNLSMIYLKKYIIQNEFNVAINENQSLQEIKEFLDSYNSDKVIELNTNYIYPSYKQNIQKFLIKYIKGAQ